MWLFLWLRSSQIVSREWGLQKIPLLLHQCFKGSHLQQSCLSKQYVTDRVSLTSIVSWNIWFVSHCLSDSWDGVELQLIDQPRKIYFVIGLENLSGSYNHSIIEGLKASGNTDLKGSPIGLCERLFGIACPFNSLQSFAAQDFADIFTATFGHYRRCQSRSIFRSEFVPKELRTWILISVPRTVKHSLLNPFELHIVINKVRFGLPVISVCCVLWMSSS